MLSYTVYLIYNAFIFSGIWITVSFCLSPKFSRRPMLLFELLSILAFELIGVAADFFPWINQIRSLLFALTLYGSAFILFNNRFFRKFLVTTCVFMALIATETILYLLFPSTTVDIHFRAFDMNSAWWYVVYLCCFSILLYIVYLLLHKKSTDNMDRLSVKQYWFFLFFPVSQIILLLGWFFSFGEHPSQTNLLILTVSALICIIADVAWLRELSRIADSARLQAENDLLGQQVEAQREYYEMLSANYTDMAMLRHDIANHIYTIRVLLQDGKSEEAISYAERLEQSRAAKTILSTCKNSVVHSFLCHKLDEFSDKGIEATFDVILASKVGIPDTDLIIALGNLLDNAAEACTAAQAQWTHLKVSQKDGFIHIETENSCSAVSLPKKRRIAYLNRGLGTSILHSLAVQYHGSYSSSYEGEKNHAVLVLQENFQ